MVISRIEANLERLGDWCWIAPPSGQCTYIYTLPCFVKFQPPGRQVCFGVSGTQILHPWRIQVVVAIGGYYLGVLMLHDFHEVMQVRRAMTRHNFWGTPLQHVLTTTQCGDYIFQKPRFNAINRVDLSVAEKVTA